MGLFHRHSWSDWAVTDRGRVTYVKGYVGWYLVQHRHCLTCGKTQVEDQAEYGDVPRSCCNRISEMQRAPRKDGVSA